MERFSNSYLVSLCNLIHKEKSHNAVFGYARLLWQMYSKRAYYRIYFFGISIMWFVFFFIIVPCILLIGFFIASVFKDLSIKWMGIAMEVISPILLAREARIVLI